jgi:phage gp36-like protein
MERYLHPGDYSIQIRTEIKTLVGGADEKKLVLAEHAAVGQMKSWLKKRYDIAQIFFLLKGAHDQAKAYSLGNLVYYKETSESVEDYKVYQANANIAANTPWNLNNWTLFTDRNPFIILYLVDLTLYHLHSKDAARLIPKVREDRYQDALDWLKGVAEGLIDADLPQLVETDPEYKPEIRYNSHPAENHRW